jgi:5-aminopentanamidase
MVPAPLSITALDTPSTPGDVTANAATAAEQIRLAHADVLVFGELFLSAYDLGVSPGCALDADDERLAPIAAACTQTGRRAFVSAPLRAAHGAHIGILLFEPGAPPRAVYRKRNLDPPERAGYVAGDPEPQIVDIEGWRLGLGVCYDAAFPEHARAAALAGAHAYVIPSAYPEGGGQERRRIYMQARALENTLYVVSADPLGALAFGPDGHERDAQLLLLDMPTLEEVRARLTMLADRHG